MTSGQAMWFMKYERHRKCECSIKDSRGNVNLMKSNSFMFTFVIYTILNGYKQVLFKNFTQTNILVAFLFHVILPRIILSEELLIYIKHIT